MTREYKFNKIQKLALKKLNLEKKISNFKFISNSNEEETTSVLTAFLVETLYHFVRNFRIYLFWVSYNTTLIFLESDAFNHKPYVLGLASILMYNLISKYKLIKNKKYIKSINYKLSVFNDIKNKINILRYNILTKKINTLTENFTHIDFLTYTRTNNQRSMYGISKVLSEDEKNLIEEINIEFSKELEPISVITFGYSNLNIYKLLDKSNEYFDLETNIKDKLKLKDIPIDLKSIGEMYSLIRKMQNKEALFSEIMLMKEFLMDLYLLSKIFKQIAEIELYYDIFDDVILTTFSKEFQTKLNTMTENFKEKSKNNNKLNEVEIKTSVIEIIKQNKEILMKI